MFLLGTIVNALAVALGSCIGMVLPSIPSRMKSTIMQGLAMAVILIGGSMALSDTNDILIIIVSLVIGALTGEWIDIENLLQKLGESIERRFHQDGRTQSRIAEGFVVASLVFCVGSMAIVGAIQSGFKGDNRILYAKSLLDGFTSIVFTSTLGIGVMLSAVPIMIYEGLIATASYFLGTMLNSPAVIACMTATGGLLIAGIGINLMEMKKIKVGNLLPAIVVSALAKWFVLWLNHHHFLGI